MSIPHRPVQVYIVHAATSQVVKIHHVDPAMTGPEIANWLVWLEAICGDDYEIEVLRSEAA